MTIQEKLEKKVIEEIEEIEEAEEESSLEDDLSGVSADLLSFRKYESFVRQLFELKPGIWADVLGLCNGLDEIKASIHKLEAKIDDTLKVLWLEHPDPAEVDFCLVLFYVDVLDWNSLAVYNKGRLLAKNPLIAQI